MDDSVVTQETGGQTDLVFGAIDVVIGDEVHGWLFSASGDVLPFLVANGTPAQLVEWPIERSDVKEALGTGQNTGYKFRVSGLCKGASVELYALNNRKLSFVAKRTSGATSFQSEPLMQLAMAENLGKLDGAVAITCWDAAHNPIGRAKVLYDVCRTKRPSVIFSYLFDEFGGTIWAPLRDTDTLIVTIPWKKRLTYYALIRMMGITFSTVWLCKPRYPTFELASVISSPNAKFILDIDDNEEQFAMSPNAHDKPYGQAYVGIARELTHRLGARTVASKSLQHEFGGHIVRHARHLFRDLVPRKLNRRQLNLGFIGSVKKHKNLLSAARALKIFSFTTKLDVKFHVYGDVQPIEYARELEIEGVHIRGSVGFAELQRELSCLDIILTGYPSYDDEDASITRYQISSKIGDSLSVGRPVLVPEGPSVNDLQDIPGVFVFNKANFFSKLSAAAAYKGQIHLPLDFTLEGAYAQFAAAENVATPSTCISNSLIHLADGFLTNNKVEPTTLLLIWKQYDAGLFGRRVDQIARSYKRVYPDNRVIILEIIHGDSFDELKKDAANAYSDAELIISLASRKLSGAGYDNDGVLYRMLKVSSLSAVPDVFREFLAQNHVTPNKSLVIIFPYMQLLDTLIPVLGPYKKIVDVVDNQLAWKTKTNSKQIALQYATTARVASHIVFNSKNTQQFFGNAFCTGLRTRNFLIENWYVPPANFSLLPRVRNTKFRLIYIGNMNDRVDWTLIRRVSDELGDEGVVHLAGPAHRANHNFFAVLECKNVCYHGPTSEREALNLLAGSDLAIMPHTYNSVSEFMNPLKLYMYSAMGIQAISTEVPGISLNIANLKIYATGGDFIEAIRLRLKKWSKNHKGAISEVSLVTVKETHPPQATEYVGLIEATMKANTVINTH
jgi:hypothetical protein